MVAPKSQYKVVKQFKGQGGIVYRLLVCLGTDGNKETRHFVIEFLMQDTMGDPAWFVVQTNALLGLLGGSEDARWAICNAIYESTLPTVENP